MSPARCAAGLRQAAVANMQTEAARRRATETKLIRAMERWEAKAAAMTPEKGAAFIRHKLKERVRLQAKYSTRRRPVEAPPTSDARTEALYPPRQPPQSPTSEGEHTLDTDAVRLCDEWFSDWFVECAASGLHCDEHMPENM